MDQMETARRSMPVSVASARLGQRPSALLSAERALPPGGPSAAKIVLQVVSIAGFLGCIVLTIWGVKTGVLTSQASMAAFVARVGIAGVFLFTLFQAVQVVIPVLPGGLSCLAGVLLFGPLRGFLCNYIGICIGSMAAFAVAKCFGRPLLRKLFSQKLIQKYDRWTETGSPFAKWFALAIFLPVAPDDFLCYLAGTTAMHFKKFTAIIWLCKPFAIAAYSLGLTVVWQQIMALLP